MTARVAVTGMAWHTALGRAGTAWEALLAGRSGVRPVDAQVPLRNTLAAPLPAGPAETLGPGALARLTAGTVREALADAGIEGAGDTLLVAGTSLGDSTSGTGADLGDWAVAAAAELGLGREPVTVSTACSSGTDAIAIGAAAIAAGAVDRCVAGGADLITLTKRLGHSGLGTMSPTTARPFDDRHDGMLLGEGAAFVVLENAEVALRRAAPVRGWVRGWGSAMDAAKATASDGTSDAAVLAIRRALDRAGLTGAQVDIVCTHGTATPVNDAVEAGCYRRVFGDDLVPYAFGVKSALGHSLGAAGAIETVALLRALADGRVPPTAGTEQVLRDFPLVLARKAEPFDGRYGINLTIGFGGFNTCLVVERGDA
nr:beta-ketoacyl synthase N-terminal-like domain-containing protein [uncultured Actinoplanes sp.]